MTRLSDDYLFRLLKDGGPAVGKSSLMGAWGRTLSPQRICDVIAHVRSLADDSPRGAADRMAGICRLNTARTVD